MEFNILKPSTWFAKGEKETDWAVPPPTADKTASWNLTYTNVQTISFNGEKNAGNAGPMLDYRPDYVGLRVRSWQAMFESDLAIIAINKMITWTIGKGLKIQSEPIVDLIKESGYTIDKNKFSRSFEQRFNLWRKSKSVDFGGQNNLTELSKIAEKNAMVAGDVLVILRVVKGELKVQLIDGQFVQSPYYGSEWFPKELPDGHLIVDGVEINEKREHIAYYVKVYAVDAKFSNLFQYKFERVECYPIKGGMKMAYMYYGCTYRIGNTRGVPLLSACFEKINNIDSYATATLKQAQEAAKVDYQVVHDKEATPTAPWASNAANGLNGTNGGANTLPITDDGVELGKSTHITGIGTAYNNSPGSKIEMLDNKNPLYFKDFFETHSDILFAVMELPPDVAMSNYNNSYSASRAAIKDFENTLDVKREHHHQGFLSPIVDLWLYLEILKNNIQAPGYLISSVSDKKIVVQSYQNVRFIGPQVPGIDPLKEIKAIREMLGDAGKSLPLLDLENAIERIGGGDANEVLNQFSEEYKLSLKLGIKPLPVEQQVTEVSTGGTKKPKETPKK